MLEVHSYIMWRRCVIPSLDTLFAHPNTYYHVVSVECFAPFENKSELSRFIRATALPEVADAPTGAAGDSYFISNPAIAYHSRPSPFTPLTLPLLPSDSSTSPSLRLSLIPNLSTCPASTSQTIIETSRFMQQAYLFQRPPAPVPPSSVVSTMEA